jgi:hypothetical protein
VKCEQGQGRETPKVATHAAVYGRVPGVGWPLIAFVEFRFQLGREVARRRPIPALESSFSLGLEWCAVKLICVVLNAIQ